MLFAGIIVIMNQFKVPTFMPTLAFTFFGGDMGATGWLMSVIAVAGIVTAFPSAFLINRFGPRNTGLVGLGCMLLGCTLGALTTDSATQLIAGRLIEGIGVAMMGVVATTLISMYFPREKAGLPMGLWNLWYVAGATVAYTAAVPITVALTGDAHAWQAWWWFCDAAALLGFVVFALLVQKPRVGRDRAARDAGTPLRRPSISVGFKVWRMWLFGLGFCLLLGTALCILTTVPTYVQYHELARLLAANPGMDTAAAQETASITGGLMSSIGFAASIPMTIVTGFLLRRFSTIKARNTMAVIAGFLALLYTGAYLIPYEYLPWYLVLLGLESGWTSGIVWAMVPLTMPRRVTMPIGMAIIIFFQGISNLLCTPITGYVIGNLSDPQWGNVVPLVFTTALLGTVVWIIYALTKPPVFEEDAAAALSETILQGKGEVK
jgi:MFS family permease